jgi:hypothetical protein
MGRFADDADYVLRWPPEIFEAEIRRLVLRAQSQGMTKEWEEEVTLLLQQAFVSSVPAEDFEKQLKIGDLWDAAEEPF